MKKQAHETGKMSVKLILFVRYMLIIPIVYSIAFMAYILITSDSRAAAYASIGDNLRIVVLSLIAMSVTFAFMRLEKHHNVHLPRVLLLSIMLFVAAALVVGDGFGQYQRLWWWDDVLHSLSGIITALTGYLLVYFFNARYSMRISPLFVAIFAFAFAVTMGALWEIFEFSMDVMFGTDMQRWNLSSNAVLIGKAYQGSGLRDTMSDLIVACVGAVIASTFAYLSYKNERSRVIQIMERTFPRLARKSAK